MADQGTNPDQPGRVEVGLSFLSAQDSAAFREMKEAFSQAATMFEAMKASSFVAEAQKLAELSQKMNTERQRMNEANERDRQMQERGGGIRGVRQRLADFVAPGQGGGDDGGKSDAQTAREKANEEDKKQKDAIKTRMEDERRRRLEAMEHMSDPQREAERRRMSAGQRPTGEFRIPSIDEDNGNLSPGEQPFYQRMRSMGGTGGGFEIPRFGELNVQDYLNEMRNRRLEEALRAGRAGDEDLMNERGDSAARYEEWSKAAGNVYAARHFFNRARSGMARVSAFTSAFETPGANLGFRRDTNPFSDVLGIQTPFSAAGRQGLRQFGDTTALRFRAGINGEQAAAITGATAQAGFSGQQGSDVATRFMAPMFRQFGVDPENLIPFTQMLKTGTGSLGELNRELGNLGETARTARTDVNSMAQALAQSGEASQQAGGYQMAGLKFGRQFTDATGLMPGTGNQLLQDNTVQAMLAGSTGLPTFAQAAAPAGAKIQATQEALRMYYNAYGGAIGTQGVRTPVTIHGERVGAVEGDNPAMAATAARFGISADEADRMLKGQDFATRSVNLENVLTMQEQRIDKGDPTEAAKKVSDVKLAQAGLRVRNGRAERQVGLDAQGNAKWKADQEAANNFNKLAKVKLTPGNDKEMRDQLVGAAHDAHISGKELGKAVDDEKDPRKRIQNVRNLMAEKAAEEQAKYQIAFTGPAKKLFKALVKNAGGNAKDWDAPDNVSYGSNQGPSSTQVNDGTNTGMSQQDFNTSG